MQFIMSFDDRWMSHLGPNRYFYHHELLTKDSDTPIDLEATQNIFRRYYRNSRGLGNWWLVAYHPVDPQSKSSPKREHIHWVHICPGDGDGWCGCWVRKQIGIRLGMQFRLLGRGNTKQHIKNIVSYLQRQPRELLCAIANGENKLGECHAIGNQIVQTKSNDWTTSNSEGYECHVREEQSTSEGNWESIHAITSGSRSTGFGERIQTKNSDQKIQKVNDIAEYIRLTLPDSKQRLIHKDKVQKILGLDLFNRSLANWMIELSWSKAVEDFNDYTQNQILNINDNLEKFNTEKYYSVQYSLIIVLLLLKEQLHTVENIVEFIETMIQWFNRKINKKNTFTIYGPPNSGKTYFTDSLVQLSWNVGLMKNINKYTGNFGYDDCFDRRLLLWNECNLSPENVDKIKEILEGKEMTADKKYENSGTIRHTPVLITSNHKVHVTVQSERLALESRMNIYNWNAQPWLKQCKRYIHPLVWKHLYMIDQLVYQINEWPHTDEINDDINTIIFNNDIIYKFNHDVL